MAQRGEEQRARVVFDPEGGDAFVQQTVSRLQKGKVAGLVLDMGRVEYAGPKALRALEAVAQAAEDAGAEILLDGVRSPVYKALQMARLGPRLRRVHHGMDATG